MIVSFPFVATPKHAVTDEIAKIMIASVRRSMPNAEIVQLTDPSTPALQGVDRVLRKACNYRFWVPWLMEFWSELPPETLLLDSDVVVQRDLTPMFNTGGDVTITSRGPKFIGGHQMPFLLGVAASRTPTFWLDVRDRVLRMTEDEQGWYGSQIALFEMWMDQQNGSNAWKIASLNCDPHNYVPKDEKDCPADKWVLHFKGAKRKPWMLSRFGEKVAA